MKINVAIIGLGVVGKRRRKYIEQNRYFNLIAVSDIRFKKNFIKKKFIILKIMMISLK